VASCSQTALGKWSTTSTQFGRRGAHSRGSKAPQYNGLLRPLNRQRGINSPA